MNPDLIRLLFVEDDRIDQMAFKRFVAGNRLPYAVRIAGSLAEAGKWLQAEVYDVVISDYKLGDGDLFDLFDLLADAPLIVITGAGDEAVAAKAMRSGAYDYLIKDSRGRYLETLAVTVEKALQQRRTEKELQMYHEKLAELVAERTRELNEKSERLEAVNAALKVLLEKREQDKTVLEETVRANISDLVTPYFEKLRTADHQEEREAYLHILESNLKAVAEPFERKLSSKYLQLTPAEIEIANLIKQGKSTKEIARLTRLSRNTIGTRRAKIRKKFGIANSRINLRTYLLSLG